MVGGIQTLKEGCNKNRNIISPNLWIHIGEEIISSVNIGKTGQLLAKE